MLEMFSIFNNLNILQYVSGGFIWVILIFFHQNYI